jgi:hypothetical protein
MPEIQKEIWGDGRTHARTEGQNSAASIFRCGERGSGGTGKILAPQAFLFYLERTDPVTRPLGSPLRGSQRGATALSTAKRCENAKNEWWIVLPTHKMDRSGFWNRFLARGGHLGLFWAFLKFLKIFKKSPIFSKNRPPKTG